MNVSQAKQMWSELYLNHGTISFIHTLIDMLKSKINVYVKLLYYTVDLENFSVKQVDILISKKQVLQILYLKHCVYKTA